MGQLRMGRISGAKLERTANRLSHLISLQLTNRESKVAEDSQGQGCAHDQADESWTKCVQKTESTSL